jgi:hypothetical protein
MSKAAQGFSPEAYLKYVEGGNPRRTPLIGKIAIYGWKLTCNMHHVGSMNQNRLFFQFREYFP